MISKILTFFTAFHIVMISILASTSLLDSPSSIEVILIIIFSLTFFVLTVWKPHYAIYTYVSASVIVGPSFLAPPYEVERRFFFYYYHFMLGDVKIFLNEMVILIGALALFINHFLSSNSFHNGRIKIKPIGNMFWWVLIFISIGIFSIIRGISKYGLQAAFGDGRIVFFSLLFFITVGSFKNTEQVNLLFQIFFLSVLARSIINLLTPFINPSYFYYSENLHRFKPFGSGTDSAYMGLCFLALLTRWIIYKNKSWRNLLLSILFMLNLVLITSRSAIIALLICLGILWLQSNIVAKFKYLMVLFFIGILTFIMLLMPNIQPFLIENLIERYHGIFNYSVDETGIWRLISWEYAYEKIAENPILGQGFGSYAQRWISGYWVNVDLHNAYLDIGLRMGLIGVGIFLIILGKSIKDALIIRFKLPEYRFQANMLFLSIIYLGVFVAFNADMREARAGTMLWIIFGLCDILNKK
jgi:O-antigen ligase